MSDIVEHLKECAKYADEYSSDVDAFKAAAAEIARLREENARLRAALKLCDEAMAWCLGGEPIDTLMIEERLAARASFQDGGK